MTVRENLRVASYALLSIPVALGVYSLLDWLFHNWMSWIGFGGYTVLLFGGLAYRLQDDLRRARPLSVFVVLFTLHCTAFVHLLRSGVDIRAAWYVPIGFVEAFLFGLILTGPGGARSEERQ